MTARNRTAPDTVSVLLDDGAVVLDMHSKHYFSLNETGACVWTALEEGVSDAAAIARLVSRFEVTEERAAASYRRLLGDLGRSRLLAREDGVPGA